MGCREEEMGYIELAPFLEVFWGAEKRKRGTEKRKRDEEKRKWGAEKRKWVT